MERLKALGSAHVYLDSNVFIYALEGFPRHARFLRDVFEGMERGDTRATTSELTLAEVLVKPLQADDAVMQEVYLETVHDRVGLGVVPVARGILIEAARWRARGQLRLPDAIHVATAISNECDAFLTNDGRIGSVEGLRILLLSDLTSDPKIS